MCRLPQSLSALVLNCTGPAEGPDTSGQILYRNLLKRGMVSPDEVGGVRPDLEVRCEVDGVLRQHSRTGKLVFTAVDVVQYMSDIVTLHPGDLIFTGTPSGVGMARGRYLTPGETIVSGADVIGELHNMCLAGTGPLAP